MLDRWKVFTSGKSEVPVNGESPSVPTDRDWPITWMSVGFVAMALGAVTGQLGLSEGFAIAGGGFPVLVVGVAADFVVGTKAPSPEE